MNKSFLVSLHDLRADQWNECKWADELFQKYALKGVALALIPQKSANQDLQAQFDLWCESLADVIWLVHGFSHQADISLPRSFWGKKIQKICHHQAEFAGLDQENCQLLLAKAQEHWNPNLPIQGFVAPTWHAPHFLKELCFIKQWPIYESRLWLMTTSHKRFSFPLSLPSLGEDSTWFKTLNFCFWAIQYLPFNLRIVLHPEDLRSLNRRNALDLFFQKLTSCRSHIAYDLFV